MKNIQSPDQLQIVPLEDFDARALEKMRIYGGTNVGQTRVKGHQINREDGTEKVGVVEVDAIITKYEIRAQELKEMIGEQLLINVLKSFGFDTFDYIFQDQITELLLELLRGIHASEDKRLHSICIGDMARGSVNFFSRPPPEDKAYWQSNSRDMAIRRLQAHVRNLYRFVVEAALATLTGVIIKETGEFSWALQTDSHVYSVNHFTPEAGFEFTNEDFMNIYPTNDFWPDEDNNEGEAEDTQKLLTVIEMKPGTVLRCPKEERTEDKRLLNEAIEKKRLQILAKVDDITINTESCKDFLTESYPICVGTMNATRKVEKKNNYGFL